MSVEPGEQGPEAMPAELPALVGAGDIELSEDGEYQPWEGD
jgi:hypothetical protein